MRLFDKPPRTDWLASNVLKFELGGLDVSEEACMRTITLVSITFAVLCTSTIGARADGSWCANYGTGPGMNCGFYSYQQCMATISGIGGSCQPNPFSGAAREPQKRYRRDN
jgi:hypothetical protein